MTSLTADNPAMATYADMASQAAPSYPQASRRLSALARFAKLLPPDQNPTMQQMVQCLYSKLLPALPTNRPNPTPFISFVWLNRTRAWALEFPDEMTYTCAVGLMYDFEGQALSLEPSTPPYLSIRIQGARSLMQIDVEEVIDALKPYGEALPASYRFGALDFTMDDGRILSVGNGTSYIMLRPHNATTSVHAQLYIRTREGQKESVKVTSIQSFKPNYNHPQRRKPIRAEMIEMAKENRRMESRQRAEAANATPQRHGPPPQQQPTTRPPPGFKPHHQQNTPIRALMDIATTDPVNHRQQQQQTTTTTTTRQQQTTPKPTTTTTTDNNNHHQQQPRHQQTTQTTSEMTSHHQQHQTTTPTKTLTTTDNNNSHQEQRQQTPPTPPTTVQPPASPHRPKLPPVPPTAAFVQAAPIVDFVAIKQDKKLTKKEKHKHRRKLAIRIANYEDEKIDQFLSPYNQKDCFHAEGCSAPTTTTTTTTTTTPLPPQPPPPAASDSTATATVAAEEAADEDADEAAGAVEADVVVDAVETNEAPVADTQDVMAADAAQAMAMLSVSLRGGAMRGEAEAEAETSEEDGDLAIHIANNTIFDSDVSYVVPSINSIISSPSMAPQPDVPSPIRTRSNPKGCHS